jgi:hypothetical protein
MNADFQKLEEPLNYKEFEALLGSHALAKSCLDYPFDYALKLRTGEVIAFAGAKILSPEWMCVEVKPPNEQRFTLPYPAPRGMDIRISDIVWVMDAPEGS